MKNRLNRSQVYYLVILLVLGLGLFLRIFMQQPRGLRHLAQSHDLEIGTAVSSWQLDDPEFIRRLLHDFSLITPENEMKFEVLQPAPGRYDFSGADKIVAFAENHGLHVRGHTLVWTNQLPEWLITGDYSREELLSILQRYIQDVVGRYRGRIQYWDVVNEALSPDGDIATNNFWMQRIGPDYIAYAFQWAHEADPNAMLFYNESYAEGKSLKSDGVITLVMELQEKGIPIDGIGFEMHTGLGWSPDPLEVAENMQRLRKLSMVVHVTEMDVRIVEPATNDDLDQQAKVYGEILQTCLEALNCSSFATWGMTDDHSWIPYVYPDSGSALIFFGNYEPKPAYYSMRDILEGK